MRKGTIGIVAVALVVAVALFAVMSMKTSHVSAGTETAAEDHSHEHEHAAPAETISKSEPITSKTYGLGDPNAPVKIKEFASLSCSHCAEFHMGTLPEVKKELIDTGKVYFEFISFPLNASAMDGTLIAMCLPEERFNQFISFLFEQQSKWAFDSNYRHILKQNAKLLGASEEKLDECLADEKLKQGIVARMQEAQEKYKIESTPSFLINESEVFTGALPYSEFKKKIEPFMPQGQPAQ